MLPGRALGCEANLTWWQVQSVWEEIRHGNFLFIYLFVLSSTSYIFILIVWNSIIWWKRGAWRYFPLNSILQRKPPPKIGPIFSFWNLVFSDKHGFWLTGADCSSKGSSRGWEPMQSQLKVIVSLTQKGHIIHIKHKRLLTHANVLCMNLWTEQSTTTGKAPDRLPSIQQKHRRTPLSTPNPTVDHFHHFSFTRGKQSRTDQPVLITSMVNHILSQHWQDQTQLHSSDVALGSGHAHLLECPSLHLHKCLSSKPVFIVFWFSLDYKKISNKSLYASKLSVSSHFWKRTPLATQAPALCGQYR